MASLHQQLHGLCVALSLDSGVGLEVKTRAAALLSSLSTQDL